MRGKVIALACTALLGAGPAFAGEQVLEYRIQHPTYGDIGTYTNIIDRNGGDVRVQTNLRIAVKVLGITMFRQEAQRVERWHDNRFVGFDGLTVTNGDKLEVHGEARGGNFAIKTDKGTVLAPGNIHPSNPWSPMVLSGQLVMSTRNGEVLPARVTGGQQETVAFNGYAQRLHQYEVDTDKRQFVWFDDRGVPVAFRTEERGTPVDFVLVRQQGQTADLSAVLPPPKPPG